MMYPDFSNTKVIVIGDIILDQYFCGDVHRISPEAPVPVVTINEKTTSLGGAGNVAVNLKNIECGHVLIGVIGNDMNGIVLSDILQKNNIENHMITIQRYPTITKTRVISQGQQIVRLDEEDISMINEIYRSKLLSYFDECLPNTTGVIISDYGKGLIDPDVTRHIITQCNSENIPVFVDPKGNTWDHYNGAFCITPNIMEFNQIEPFMEDTHEKSKILLDKHNLKNILLTRGSEGMILFSIKQEPIYIKSEVKEVYDVSGAGDTVIAFMASSFGSGMSMEKSAEIANIAAGIVVGKQGTKPIEQIELKQIFLNNNEENIRRIVSREQAIEKIKEWKKNGDTIVGTTGCFDILHVGHIKLIHTAIDSGDRLVIGLNSDSSIKKLKGESRPIISENERANILSNINGVDLVVIYDEETSFDFITSIEPDVIVKGSDHRPITKVGNEMKDVTLVSLDGNSTTNIINTIKKGESSNEI